MPQRVRGDCAGAWFHVMNRGVARRSMFENGGDAEVFFEGVAQAVDNGSLEVHAYTLMATHYHMLVRSPTAEMAKGMHQVQLHYSRYFNRSRKRDGPLVRSRYRSRRVETDEYRRVLIRYIDANPVQAGIVRDPAEYPFGSCQAYVHGDGPSWLSRGWVQGHVGAATGAEFDGGRYLDVIGSCSREQAELVERRVVCDGEGTDPVASFLAHDNLSVAQWLKTKSRLADGTSPGVPLAGRPVVLRMAMGSAFGGPAMASGGGRKVDWQRVATALLLREVAGASYPEIAADLGCATESARSWVARGRVAMGQAGAFAAEVATVARMAVHRTWCAPAATDIKVAGSL